MKFLRSTRNLIKYRSILLCSRYVILVQIENAALKFLQILLFAAVIFPLMVSTNAVGQAYFPDTLKLLMQNGALIFIRRADEWIPYNSEDSSIEFDNKIEELQKNKKLISRFPILKTLNYEEFYAGYFEGKKLDKLENYRRGPSAVGVGHVAIVQVINGEPHIIEAANPRLGVVRSPLVEWLNSLPNNTQFWIGHFKTSPKDKYYLPAQKIDEVIRVAEEQVIENKPYDFFNFDLEDGTTFYCSKLVWYSVFRATGKKLDDGITHALPWYSPKQLLSSQYINIIANPDTY